VDPDTRAPFVGWLTPTVTAGDTVFVFTEDTTTVVLNAGDDGGIISRVQVYLDGALAATLTAAPYQTQLSLAGIRNNRSARVWATATDPTGKIGSTADTLRFVHSVLPDTATWSQLSPAQSPLARDGFTWELDPATETAYLFGGYSIFTFSSLGDLWSFDLSTNQWDSLSPLGVAPPARVRHGAGLAAGTMVIFAGQFFDLSGDSLLEDYALLDLGTLTWNAGQFDLALRPTQAMSTATFGNDVYAFGGVDISGQAHDTLLRYHVTTDQWQSLSPVNSLPGARASALVAANLEDADLFLFGGNSGVITDPPASASNYRLDLGSLTWASTAAPGPPALAEGGAIYDSALHRILVWGGRDGAGGHPVEVWEFALGAFSWRQVPTMGTSPTGRTGHRIVYDAARRRLVMFGGRDGATFLSETWELSW